MTDAIAATQNTVSCGDSTRTDNSTNDILCKAQNTTSSQPKTSVITDDTTSKKSTNQTLEPSSNIIIKNCDTAENATQICEKEQVKIDLTKNKDNIPKYLYKTSSMSSVTQKSKGHSKNSLKRKRRSLEINPNLDSDSAKPVSVDYSTLHDVEQIERTVSPQTEHVIKKEDLANFNIETLHEDLPTKIQKEGNHNEPHVNIYNLKDFQKNKEDDESKELHIDQQELRKKESLENSSNETVESDENSYESKPKAPSLSYKQNINDDKIYSDEINTQKDKESTESESVDPSHKSYKDNPEVSSEEDKEHSYSKTVPNENGHLIRNSNSDNREGNPKHNEDHLYGKQNSNEDTGPFFNSNKEIPEVNPKLDKGYANEKTNSNEDSGPFSNPSKDTRQFDSELDKDYSLRKTNSNEDFGPFIDSNRDIWKVDSKVNKEHANLKEDTPLNNPNKFVQEVHSEEVKDNSYERPNSKEDTGSFYSPKNDNRKFISKQNRHLPYSRDNSNEDDKSEEKSSEQNVSDKLKTDKIPESYEEIPVATITPKVLHDVNLDNINYERIHVNDKSKIVPSKEIEKNNYSEEVIEPITIQPETAKSGLIFTPLAVNDDSSSVEHKPSDEPINFNDGEVKPVVELNSEDESNESSEETATELQNGNLKSSKDNDYNSKERQINSKEVNEKLIARKDNDSEKGNVKQQFERIPLDYRHDDEKNTQKETNNNNYANPNKDNKEENINDGTLDALTPKVNKRYDDDLNIKFDDIAIKLPEINLPDDILSYAYIGRPDKEKKKEEKKTFYHFGDDDSAENSEEQKKSVAGVHKNHGYFDLYNNDKSTDHENYKTSIKHDNDDDDNEDLYEKFVRERFGKKSSYGKRSEKLQATERNLSNPVLLETIQSILKKTEDIQKEAEKSGDPKAGYMWTLEYGENL